MSADERAVRKGASRARAIPATPGDRCWSGRARKKDAIKDADKSSAVGVRFRGNRGGARENIEPRENLAARSTRLDPAFLNRRRINCGAARINERISYDVRGGQSGGGERKKRFRKRSSDGENEVVPACCYADYSYFPPPISRPEIKGLNDRIVISRKNGRLGARR